MKSFGLWVLPAMVLSVCLGTAESAQLVGQGNDGNRSKPVHWIELYSADGTQICSYDKDPKPFSTRQTCGRCHDYDAIASGWHFNGHDSEIEAGRPGEPWVLTDSKTRTQVPLSGRKWKGTFTPESVGVSPWEFVNMNFSHFPGGSYGEMRAEEPDEAIRQEISGTYEINCLACHNADPHQDQSKAAMQAARQNYQWIAAESSGKADISGVASFLDDFFDPQYEEGVKTAYKPGIFGKDEKVFFNIKQPVNDRCYFCHSNQNLSVDEPMEWTCDEDVHLKAGLNCIDCHRNGQDHMISRGTETEGPDATLSCEGCHLGEHHADIPESGRLGAPQPTHRGIPAVHFEKLTCTACHSGSWPEDQAGRWRTARMHQTGLHGTHNLNLQQPHVYAPVLMKGEDGKIGPYKMFWPSYWAKIADGQLSPIAPEEVLRQAGTILDEAVTIEDDWRPLSEEQIAAVLKEFASSDENIVYVAGGRIYELNQAGALESRQDDAAKPYAWPMAHDVRPAKQSLGVRQCKDCHTADSAFFFGKVQVDTPVTSEKGPEFVDMIQWQGIDPVYMRAFNASFVFRPMLKIVALASCAAIGLVLLAYLVQAVAKLLNACVKEPE